MIATFLSSLVRLFTGARGRWIPGAFDAPGPRVFFANHSSHLDFVVLWSVLPRTVQSRTRAAAARDYWTGGPLRRWLASKAVFNVVLIERKQVTRTNNPVRDLGEVLSAGDSLIIFPEGTRSAGSDPAPFKGGLYHLAEQHPEAELIPVLIDNLNRVLPKGELLPIPLICSVTFGAPLSRIEGEAKDAFSERARSAVIALREQP
ncbi:MAG: 1-acyl-sn-glycerol-3-phosphate acyltransferase [Opitutaceae bacterium]|nr:1-acyl-sn-glycerol-3-phosphate acyltransferase [Opitutaceae bacterium]